MTGEDIDLARAADRSAAVRLPGSLGDVPAIDGAWAERLEDALRPDAVARAWRGARSAPERFRLLAPAWLDRAGADVAAELARRLPPRDVREMVEPDPRERRRIHEERADTLRRLEGLLSEWADVRRTAAQAAGAASVAAFLAARDPLPVEETLARFEEGAIRPLDEAVGSAARRRRRESRWAQNDPPHAADVEALRGLSGLDNGFTRVDVRRAIEALGRVVGPGPRWHDATGSPTAAGLDGKGEAVITAGGEPPCGLLLRTLRAFGRGARTRFVREVRGSVACWGADPAFDHAAARLFGRLALSSRFREEHGPAPDPVLDHAIRLELALAPRRDWAYLELVMREANGGTTVGGADPVAVEVFRRATGEPPTLADAWCLHEADPGGAAALRGTVYALLIEERLLLRHGHGWFAERRAAGWLREVWEAEPDATAESMAATLGLGTMDSTPILDRCRP